MTNKDKQIIEDAEKTGTPIFVFTAKDSLSFEILVDYLSLCAKARCSAEHIGGVTERIGDFIEWQSNCQNRTRKPD